MYPHINASFDNAGTPLSSPPISKFSIFRLSGKYPDKRDALANFLTNVFAK